MEMEIITAITTVGFPIVACIAMGWYVKYITDKHEKAQREESERHKIEMEKMTEALNNNTLALTILTENIKKTEE